MEWQNKTIQSNRYDILLGQRQNTTKPFPHTMGGRKERPSGLFLKTPPIWHHRRMRPRYVKATKTDKENLKHRQNGTGSGYSGTTNPRGTWKLDTPPEGIRNPITHNPYNPLKGIRNIVTHKIRSQ